MLRLFGWCAVILGSIAILANLILARMGFDPSVNVGDPSKFQFYLIELWQVGVAVLGIGCIVLWLGRRSRSG